MRMHSGVTPGGMPTLVVAASNSLHPERADYRADGTGDQTEINAAITALATTGGKVVLMEGTFVCDFYIAPVSNVVIEGQGDATIVQLANGRHSTLSAQALAAQANLTVVDGTQFRAGDWICIKDVGAGAVSVETRLVQTVVGNVITVTANLGHIHPIATEVWTWHPLFLTSAAVTDFTLKNLRVDGNRDNQMIGVLGEVFSTAVGQVVTSDPTLIDLEMCGDIAIVDSAWVEIDHVFIKNMPEHGVFFWGKTQNTDHITVTNCDIENIADKGIVSLQFVNTQDVDARIERNYIDDVGNGVRMVVGLGINYGDAIEFHLPGGHRINVNDNVIGRTKRSGIFVDDCFDVQINRNILVENDTAYAGYGGIIAWRCDAVEVVGNIARYTNCHKGCLLWIASCQHVHVTGGCYHFIGTGEPGAIPFQIDNSLSTTSDDISLSNVFISSAATMNTSRVAYMEHSSNLKFNQCVFKNPTGGQVNTYLHDVVNAIFSECAIYDDTGVQTYAVQLNGTGYSGIVFDRCDLRAGATGTMLDPLGNVGCRLAQPFLCVLAYGTNNILAASANGTYSATTQIDLCRNLVAKITKGTGTGNGQITVTGVDQFGNAVVETYTFVGGATATQVMVKLFSTINTNGIVISGLTGTDTIELGVGNKLGLVSKIFNGAVAKCSNGTGFIATAGYAEDVTYHGVDFTVHGAIAAGDVYTIFYKNCLA